MTHIEDNRPRTSLHANWSSDFRRELLPVLELSITDILDTTSFDGVEKQAFLDTGIS